MSSTPTDPDARFAARYAASGAAAMLAAERDALGSDYQANGYTTRDQADEMGRRLGLRPGLRLLDLGAGCGWPGLYLASKHGSAVISVDPVAAGIETAAERIVVDGLVDRGWALRGAGDAIPIRSGTIDAVVHTDLLC